MHILNLQDFDLRSIAEPRERPVLSLYMPTEKAGPKTRQSPIRFKNLVRRALDKLETAGVDGGLADNFRNSSQPLLDDYDWWQHQDEGAAIFCDEERFDVVRLTSAPEEAVTLGRRFHLKPLLPLVARSEPFYLLALSGAQCRLYRGGPGGLEEVQVDGLPESLEHALRFDDPEKSLQFHTESAATGPGGHRPAVFHGQGSSVEDRQDRFLRYFRECDRALSGFLNDQRTPLLLAAVDEHAPLYRKANTYAGLMTGRWVSGSPDDASTKDLHRRATRILDEVADECLREQIRELEELLGRGKASVDLEQVAKAAKQGKVRSAFVANDRSEPGVLDGVGGGIERKSDSPNDILNDIAAETLLMGGEVTALPSDTLPNGSSAAAIFRF